MKGPMDRKADKRRDADRRQDGDDPLYHFLYIPRGIERLEKLGTLRRFPKGHELNLPGEVPDRCYLVKSGRVIGYEISYAGEMRVYNFMEPGSMFLEECLLFDKPCPVTFKAATPVELICIDKCDLKRAFKRDIDVVMDVCESLSTKFLSAMDQLRLGFRQDAGWKICKLLVIMAQRHGVLREDGSILIKERMSHQAMAELLGMNRVTVTRKMKELRESGLIGSQENYYILPDMETLVRYMQDMETVEK